MYKQLMIGLLIAIGAFACGFIVSVQEHGDWLVARSDTGMCEAIEPSGGGKIIGHWPLADDGRCHMGQFLLRHLLP